MKGYCVPDESLRSKKGYDALENLSRYDLTIHSSIDSLVLTLFNFNYDHLVIESGDNKWTQFFRKLFIENSYSDKLYGHSYDLEDFFRGVLRSIIIFGKAFYAVDYLNDVSEGYYTIERIRWLPVETMTPSYQNGVIKIFTQEYSSKCNYEGVRNSKAEFSPEEIFFLEWIFDDNKGISPLHSLQKNSGMENKFFDFAQKQFYAIAHPDDHSRITEKARYSSFEKEKKKSDAAKLKSTAKIGGIIRAPMTDYYDAYYFARNRKKVATIREYLVNQFNSQILSVISSKNGLAQSARLKIVGYLSSAEIEKMIEEHKNLKLSSKELVDTLARDMRPINELTS